MLHHALKWIRCHRIVLGSVLAASVGIFAVCLLWPTQAARVVGAAKEFLVGPPTESTVEPTDIGSTPLASPLPSVTDQLQERVADLEKQLATSAAAVAKITADQSALRDDFQAALAEVATHNDLLQKKGKELSIALENVGLTPASPKPVASEPSSNKKVNINTASAEELATLPGIGAAYAERIVAYRTEHGKFTSIDDLDGVTGIGPATIAKLRDLTTV